MSVVVGLAATNDEGRTSRTANSAGRQSDGSGVVVIRCTQKLLSRVGPSGDPSTQSTTLLGDWFAHPFSARRRRLVMLVSARTRLPIVLPAIGVKGLASNIANALPGVLEGLGVEGDVVLKEIEKMGTSVFLPTNSRSVLGTVNEFVLATRFRLYDEPNTDLLTLSLWLSETPILPLKSSPDIMTCSVLGSGVRRSGAPAWGQTVVGRTVH
jgi:hypothetical protein